MDISTIPSLFLTDKQFFPSFHATIIFVIYYICNIIHLAAPSLTMTDRLTPQQRHNTMAAIKGKNTKPEMIVRRYLWNNGFRYRLNHPRLPGKPDIVLRKYRTCIFINGCFWHGHEGCKLYTIPKSNIDYWKSKITRNKERDIEVQKKLAAMGWHCLTIWECQLSPSLRCQTLQSLSFTLNSIFLQNHKVHTYTIPEEEELSIAAEDTPSSSYHPKCE